MEHTTLTGKRILVTGGTTGIGRATVHLLAREGARVLTFGRHQRELDDALAATAYNSGQVLGLTADSSTREGIADVFGAVDDRLGGIDMLVCCAALGAEPIHEMAEDDWRYVIETNLVGYLACARHALDRMLRDRGGHIVLISSISTQIMAPGESVYAATKAGIEAFAETLRKEIRDRNVRISVIQPGSVDTDMQECSEEEKRQAIARDEMLHAEEIAEGVLFVLTRSARADVVTLRIEPRLQKTS
ncbi:MAG: SDR family oxidoreductase [Novosphingobium sp.]|nr:SDR family oxidoreductase [Novosphingobium sp.]